MCVALCCYQSQNRMPGLLVLFLVSNDGSNIVQAMAHSSM